MTTCAPSSVARPDRWLREAPVIERHGDVDVLREDLLEGGSKLRFLPFLVGDAREIVYGGPFCGGAPLALSVLGREFGRRITLFYAARKNQHERQRKAAANGARIIEVRPGYMTVVQKRARDYAEQSGALFLPLGFDVPAAIEPLLSYAEMVRRQIGSPSQVWCATGSGMLARCLASAFPDSEVCAVPVGLASRHERQEMPANLRWHATPLRFEQPERQTAPFPSCAHYERKAWVAMNKHRRGSALFWNVMS
jgi:hypothetical protein